MSPLWLPPLQLIDLRFKSPCFFLGSRMVSRLFADKLKRNVRELPVRASKWLLLIIFFPILAPCVMLGLWGPVLRRYLTRKWQIFRLKVSEKRQALLMELQIKISKQHRSLLKRKLIKHMSLRKAKKSASQSSALLRLPLEIQLIIWRMVYEDTVIHMCWRPKGVGHFVCPEGPPLRSGGLLESASY